MKFIPPLEISSKIMTLIEEAKTELVLVSPYVEVSKWDKLKKCIERAINRGVKLTFIARKNAKQDLTYLEQTGVKLILIDNLHAKLYYNESYGIVTSQNLVYYSDINSIDIAYKTTSNLEKNELIEFVNKYIIQINAVESADHINTKLNIRTDFDYDDVVSLKDWQLDKLIYHFKNTYYQVKFKTTSSYIFSGHLIPFADTMISANYILKFRKSTNNAEEIINQISQQKFSLKNKFRIDLRTKHKTFYYIEFVPQSNFNFENLMLDFTEITNKILELEVSKKRLTL